MLSVAKHPKGASLPGPFWNFFEVIRPRLSPTPCWDWRFLRFAQDFGKRLGRRLNASTSRPVVAQNDTPSTIYCANFREPL